MRDIKFRRAHFKDEAKTQFCYFSEWGKNVGKIGADFCSPSFHNGAMFCEDLQFTGLKDKNGIEVYEGDILNHKDWKTRVPFVGLKRMLCFGRMGALILPRQLSGISMNHRNY